MIALQGASKQRGFALPAALITLVLLSALVAGALFVSTEELRAGRGDMANQRALAVAEWALNRAIVRWSPEQNTAQRVGSTVVLADTAVAPNERVVVSATRVQQYGVWIASAATAGGDGGAVPARHTVGASLRLVVPIVPARAALTANGAVGIDGGVIDGRDSTAVDTTRLCADRQPGAGVSLTTASQVTCITCVSSPGTGVFGAPPIDSSAARDSLLVGTLADSLAERATAVLAGGTLTSAPSTISGACNRADPLNWGDPRAGSACANWYPVIYVQGAAELAAGSLGQGLLIVRGSLRVRENVRFAGVVVATNGIDVDGIGAEIVGAAFSGGGSRVSNGGAVRLDGCALRRATLGAARLARTPLRWWIELR